MKQLSRSVGLMFIFDLLVFTISTYCLSNIFCSFKLMMLTVALVTVVGLFSLFLKGQYKIREHNVTVWNAYRLLEGVVFAHIPTVMLIFFVSVSSYFKFALLNILSIFIVLKLYRAIFHYYLFEFKKVKKVLVVGANERANIIANVIKEKYALKMEVIGIVKSAEADKLISEYNSKTFGYELSADDYAKLNHRIEQEKSFNNNEFKIYENGKDIHNLCIETDSDIVIFTYPSCLATAIPEKIKEFYMPDFYEMATGKYYLDKYTASDFALDFMKYNRTFKARIYDFCKRIFDIIAATIILTVTLPITGVTALRIWLTDHENPIFTQDRVGKNGKIFKCYKLRTMWANNFVPNDRKKVGYVEDQNQDDRVIPFCKFVRKARFDEIPQMINILKGEMSIVGPRAEWTEVAEVYKDEVLGYRLRQVVKTAWTGWAQINQGYCFASDNESIKLAYDLYYIKHRNILWEISILIKAVFLALGGRHG